VDDVREVFLLAYRLKCKGVTIYRYGTRKQQVLELAAPELEVPAGLSRFRLIPSIPAGARTRNAFSDTMNVGFATLPPGAPQVAKREKVMRDF